jgi:hypothetical protein
VTTSQGLLHVFRGMILRIRQFFKDLGVNADALADRCLASRPGGRHCEMQVKQSSGEGAGGVRGIRLANCPGEQAVMPHFFG